MVCKGTGVRYGLHDLRAVQINGEQTGKVTAHGTDILLRNIDQAIPQAQVQDLLLGGEEVHLPHAVRLGLTVGHEPNIAVLVQLGAVGMSIVPRAADDIGPIPIAGDRVIRILRQPLVVGGDLAHSQCLLDLVNGGSLDLEGETCPNIPLGDIRRCFLKGDFVQLRHLGVQGHVFPDGVDRFHAVLQCLIVIPAQEHIAALIGGGQIGNTGSGGVGRGFGQGQTILVDPVACRECDFIIAGRGTAAGGTAAGGSTAGGTAAAGGLFLRLAGRFRAGGDARLLIPGLDSLVGVHTQRRGLSASGGTLRVEIHAVTAEQPGPPQLQNGVPGIIGNAVKIRGAGGDIRAGIIVHAERFKVVYKEGRHLLAGHQRVR